MATFDPTILDLILTGVPSNLTAAHEALKVGHPNAFADTVGAAVTRALEVNSVTSGSSVSIGTGSKVFVVGETRSWPEGAHIVIVDDAAPAANFMAGTVSDITGTSLTVDVTLTGGTGTKTAWTLYLSLHVGTNITAPVSQAQGGFGATDWINGRRNVELIWAIEVAGVTTVPSAGEGLVDDNGVDKVLVASPGTGEFTGKEWQVAEWVDDHWEYNLDGSNKPDRTTLVFDVDQLNWWQLTGDGVGGHYAQLLTPTLTPVIDASTNQSPAFESTRKKLVAFMDTTAGALSFTIPVAVGVSGAGQQYEIWNVGNPANNLTINVASGGTINGSASVVLANTNDRCLASQRTASALLAVTS